MNKNTKSPIESIQVTAPVKLSLLWASLISLYIYNDYLLFFIPGQIEGMSAGSMGPFGQATEFPLIHFQWSICDLKSREISSQYLFRSEE